MQCSEKTQKSSGACGQDDSGEATYMVETSFEGLSLNKKKEEKVKRKGKFNWLVTKDD